MSTSAQRIKSKFKSKQPTRKQQAHSQLIWKGVASSKMATDYRSIASVTALTLPLHTASICDELLPMKSQMHFFISQDLRTRLGGQRGKKALVLFLHFMLHAASSIRSASSSLRSISGLWTQNGFHNLDYPVLTSPHNQMKFSSLCRKLGSPKKKACRTMRNSASWTTSTTSTRMARK